jgi:hypothetical protein
LLKTALYVGAVILGAALGVSTALLAVSGSLSTASVDNGIWSTNLTIGSADAGPYTRASIALNGTLALKHTETIYFSADSDEEGDALTSRCTYVLEGRDPAARWWSVTVYDTDGYLLPQANGRYSVSKSSVMRSQGGTFQIALTRDGNGPNGLPTGPGDFTLTLRLYNPTPALASAPDKATLPKIKKGSCQ